MWFSPCFLWISYLENAYDFCKAVESALDFKEIKLDIQEYIYWFGLDKKSKNQSADAYQAWLFENQGKNFLNLYMIL